MKKKISHILTTLMLIFNYGQLNAAVFPTFEGDSSGIFTGVVGGDDVSPLFLPIISWGTPPNFFGDQSSLSYAGNNPFAISNSDPFSLGTLEYSNTQINAGTGISNVDLTINLDFINPSIGAFDFIVNLAVDNTSNTGSGSSNSDTVTFSTISNFPSFNIDNINYFFTILGFQDQNGVIVNSFTQLEGASDSVALFGQITAVNPIPVPATFWLILTAFFGLFVFNRRKPLIVSSD